VFTYWLYVYFILSHKYTIIILVFSCMMLFTRWSPVEEYDRSWEQNEELGLNDIDTSSADAAYHSTDPKTMGKTEV
jgi:hypothetical protein